MFATAGSTFMRADFKGTRDPFSIEDTSSFS
jgi:hypothetical protein